MVSTCRGKQLRTRELLRPPVTWCEHTHGHALSEHIAHSLCFLPPQQKMAQKIMKMIQGDFIEKPDFALKSIGTWLPLAPRTPTICPHQVSPETLQKTDFSSGLEHSLLPGSSRSELTAAPPTPMVFLLHFSVASKGGLKQGEEAPHDPAPHSPSSRPRGQQSRTCHTSGRLTT